MPQSPPILRNSLYSTDSTTTYASTLSSLTSSLGLTESPLPPAKKTMAVLESVRDQSGDIRRQAMLRGQKSRGDLRAGGGAVTQRVQSFENIRKGGGNPSGSTEQSPARARPKQSQPNETSAQRPSSQLRTRHSSPQLETESAAQTPRRQAPPRVEVTRVPSPPSTVTQLPSKSQIAIPVRRPPPSQQHPSHRQSTSEKPPVSPAASDDRLADDWDAELRRNAQNFNLRPEASAVVTRQQPREVVAVKSGKDEWEMAAMRIDRRETGREAEERTRRDPTREIAYPPAMPRMAIRAAPTGVTSIHVGVRPRIHPTRTEESLSRNQPDVTLPEPLFSPNAASHVPLASPSGAGTPGSEDGTVRGSYGNRYKGELAEKAQREYEDWLAKKAEREGGRDEDGASRGAQEWEPRVRTRARFGELNQPVSSHPDRDFAAAKMGMGTGSGGGEFGYGPGPGQAGTEYGYGYTGYPFPNQQSVQPPAMIQAKSQEQGQLEGQMQQGYQEYDQNGYPYNQQQGYWDPMAYWWAMAQMQMQMQGMSMEDIQAYGMGMGMLGDGMSPITSEESSQGSSDDGQQPKIHFAPSPKKDKGKLKRQPSEIDFQQQQLQQQQMYQQQYGQEAYDP